MSKESTGFELSVINKCNKKEIADYSATKSYLGKNNLHCFTFSPNSEKAVKVIILSLPSDTPAEGICDSESSR
jgi:hypothetical protein